jgi:signal peptidase I
MKRLRPFLLAAVALVAPVPGLIASGAGWRVVAVFGAMFVLGSALWAFVPIPSVPWLVVALAALLALQLVAAVLALQAARRTQGQPQLWFRRWYAVPLWLLLTIGLAPSTWLGLASRSYSIVAGSMEPTLRTGERFVTQTLASPAATGLHRGEIVTYRRGDTEWVKRLIGLPADRVQMRAGRLLINGEVVPREFVGPYTIEGDGPRITARLFRETLPGADGRPGVTHQLLELADDGPFDNTPEFRVPEGHVFVMGDHRDNSLDSRVMSAVGFIPLSAVTGRARFVFWSSGSGRIGTRLDGTP